MLLIIIILSVIINGVRVINSTKVVYVTLMSVMTPIILYLYLLLLSLAGLVIVAVVRAYFGYWVICVNMIVLIVLVYLVMDVKLVWLGVLPLLIFFQKQNIVMMFFMLKVIWFY